jgi:putative acetyltransferase
MNYQPRYSAEIADLFYRSVHSISTSVYSLEQQEAWAPTPPDYERWSIRLEQSLPYVAVVEGRIVGFIELELDGHIDCLYCDPYFQRKGIASSLLVFVLDEAREANMKRLYVEASTIAKPFFRHHRFSELHRNNVEINGVSMTNYSTEYWLESRL